MSLQPQSRHVERICPSPNFNDRRAKADILLLHYTGMETAEAALDWLCRPEAQVSCHYFVFEDGQIVQLVRFLAGRDPCIRDRAAQTFDLAARQAAARTVALDCHEGNFRRSGLNLHDVVFRSTACQ